MQLDNQHAQQSPATELTLITTYGTSMSRTLPIIAAIAVAYMTTHALMGVILHICTPAIDRYDFLGQLTHCI